VDDGWFADFFVVDNPLIDGKTNFHYCKDHWNIMGIIIDSGDNLGVYSYQLSWEILSTYWNME
jgi:hypothetical protein